MKQLTAKEEEIMTLFWAEGPMFVKELLAFYNAPKPHFNTLSTIVRGLEEKGFLDHESFGNSYKYIVAISEAKYRNGTLKKIVDRYFDNSWLGVVSSLIREEEISTEELKRLINEVEQGKK